MELNTPYPPLIRAPLKLRGVFGLSWQLFKRGFWPMFGFTLLLIGVFILILMLAMGNMLAQTGVLEAIENDIMPGMGNSPPYSPALCTALYVDAAARMPDLPDGAEPPAAPLPQAE